MRTRAVLLGAAAVVLLVSCTDSRPTTPAAAARLTPVNGPLDAEISALTDALFSGGLATSVHSRWDNVKRQLAANPNGANQMPDGTFGPAGAARKMFAELASWIQGKEGQMTPTAPETPEHGAAHLVLDMALYVYNGADTPPPSFLPSTDATVGIVTPTGPDTVQTPSSHAGAAFRAGAVKENTVVVISQETQFYPTNCTGPLVTHLCQYPQFYHFHVFPDVKLQLPAEVAVCHVNSGETRYPLADHDRFRLAHDKPANPANYSPGSTIVDNVEIFALTFIPGVANCAVGDNYNSPPEYRRAPGGGGNWVRQAEERWVC